MSDQMSRRSFMGAAATGAVALAGITLAGCSSTSASSEKSSEKEKAVKPVILVTSFGTSYNDSRHITIGAIEDAIREKYWQDYDIRRAFTAQIIIDKLKKRDGITIDNMTEALDRCVEDGVKEIVVQPTHLMAGLEYADVKDELDKYADKFDKISLGDPLLTSDDDYKKVAAAIKENMASFDDGKTALCLMGHGTEADSNADYAKMQEVFKNEGLTQFFVGTVEAEPTCEDVIAAASAAGYKKAVLAPFMVVAGDHANNDMADETDPDSWAAKFVAAGFEVTCLLQGLGQNAAVDDIYVSHVDDAIAKLQRGQFIMIREGTAARNLEALVPLLTPQYAERCMFCTDDKHPSDLLEKGHIDYIAREAINKYGVDPIIAVKAACHHASRYFLLNNRGAIAPGYLADFAVIDNFKDFNVEMVFKKGVLYWNNGELRDFEAPQIEEYLDKRAHDTFHVATLTPDDFRDTRQRGVLGMVPGEIITTDNGYADHVDLEKDILKIAVVERHKGTHHIGLGYIQGYGLRSGAVATSISHDSHNIIVVGTNSADMAFAANYIVEHHGGIVVAENGVVKGSVVLEIAGIMSDRPLTEVNDQLEAAKAAAFELGVSRGIDPFMTLSFMALPVIPTLRITTRGIIDVVTQQYI